MPLQSRRVRLFRNNQSQAVRIPRDWELPGNEALIAKDGDRLIIEPAPLKKHTPEQKAALWFDDRNWPLYSGPPIDDSREAIYGESRGL